jgi:glucokinase
VNDNQLLKSSITRLKCNANAHAIEILDTWKKCIMQCMSSHNDETSTEPFSILNGIGIAMPGPFDYNEGISLMRNLGKYDSIFGVNVRQYFSSEFNLNPSSIVFLNDAACFALGEYFYGALKHEHDTHRKCLFLTIGSGFGSTFLSDGKVVSKGDSVPEHGWLYHVAFRDSRAEDYFSDKWIMKRYKSLTIENKIYDKEHEQFSGVNDIPDNDFKSEFYGC